MTECLSVLCSSCSLYYVAGTLYGSSFVFQAEDGIRDLVRSRGLGDVYKRQDWLPFQLMMYGLGPDCRVSVIVEDEMPAASHVWPCLLYTSDAADERSSVDLGGRRIIKKKKKIKSHRRSTRQTKK